MAYHVEFPLNFVCIAFFEQLKDSFLTVVILFYSKEELYLAAIGHFELTGQLLLQVFNGSIEVDKIRIGFSLPDGNHIVRLQRTPHVPLPNELRFFIFDARKSTNLALWRMAFPHSFSFNLNTHLDFKGLTLGGRFISCHTRFVTIDLSSSCTVFI